MRQFADFRPSSNTYFPPINFTRDSKTCLDSLITNTTGNKHKQVHNNEKLWPDNRYKEDVYVPREIKYDREVEDLNGIPAVTVETCQWKWGNTCYWRTPFVPLLFRVQKRDRTQFQYIYWACSLERLLFWSWFCGEKNEGIIQGLCLVRHSTSSAQCYVAIYEFVCISTQIPVYLLCLVIEEFPILVTI